LTGVDYLVLLATIKRIGEIQDRCGDFLRKINEYATECGEGQDETETLVNNFKGHEDEIRTLFEEATDVAVKFDAFSTKLEGFYKHFKASRSKKEKGA
jgi:sugar-specific transcriptional regulator TrmB